MILLSLNLPRRRTTLLCIGAHADDIEIGCGGTVLELVRTVRRLHVYWLVLAASGRRAAEAQESARRFLRGAAQATVAVEHFRDGFLPAQRERVKERFELLKREARPDLILTHHEGDLHQDHDLVARLSRETFRDHLILGYEVPKFDGGLGSPNLFVPLDARTRHRKVDLLMTCYRTQRTKRWFTPATFEGIMRLRGVEGAARTGYAEGFHAHKLVLGGRSA
jgi:LmbE family N-acetylglucosaminyl deacetylase